jgi:hypothetical protein
LYTQEPPDYNDSREYDNAMWNPKPDDYPGRKELPGGGKYDRTDPLVRGAGIGRSGIKNNILDRGKRKGLPSRDQITSLKQSIRDISGQHTRANLPEQGVAEGLNEMDKSAPQPGRDGKVSHSTYGSRDKKGSDYFKGKEAPGKPITKKQMEKDALDILKKQGVAEGNRKPEQPEADYGADYQDMVTRVKKLAGMGPLKTVYDPAKRVYKNMPTAVQPKKEQR